MEFLALWRIVDILASDKPRNMLDGNVSFSRACGSSCRSTPGFHRMGTDSGADLVERCLEFWTGFSSKHEGLMFSAILSIPNLSSRSSETSSCRWFE